MLGDGRRFSVEQFRSILKEEIRKAIAEQEGLLSVVELESAGGLLDRLATHREFADFMTLQAYDLVE